MAFVPTTSPQWPTDPVAAASMEFLRNRMASPEVQKRLSGALFDRQAGVHTLVDDLLKEGKSADDMAA